MRDLTLLEKQEVEMLAAMQRAWAAEWVERDAKPAATDNNGGHS